MKAILLRLLPASLSITMTLMGSAGTAAAARQDAPSLQSPDGSIEVRVQVEDALSYSVYMDGRAVLAPSPLALTLEDGRTLGQNPRLRRTRTRSVDEEIRPMVYNKSVIRDRFNELRLEFRDDYAVVFRAYDEGVAYRFETELGGTIRITSEQVSLNFPREPELILQPTNSFHLSYENLYRQESLTSFRESGEFAALPFVASLGDGRYLAFTESDLIAYPGLFMTGAAGEVPGLCSAHPAYVLATDPGGHMNFALYATEEASYIAETDGTRTFPWRISVLARRDADLLDSDLVFLLARAPEEGSDFSWVDPGKVMWDWWHATMLRGVDFESGINTETYLHYIDFAAENGLEYINLDEGWSDQFDLLKVNPEVDVERIIEYGRSKNVGVFLWCVARTLDAQLEPATEQFERWGVKGLKVDFMERDDQGTVDFYWRIAREAARRHLLLNFHGANKPTGLNRPFPNVLNYEAVRGLEYNKFDQVGTTPEYAATIPFVRMVAGFLDYTPGAMTNAQEEDYRTVNRRPMSQGTRAAQLAMYVLFRAPLAMLSDAPYRYSAEPEVLDYLRTVPTTWDETVAVDGRLAAYAVVARRKGNTWYVGGLTDWTPRDLTVDFSFLDEGRYRAEIFRDGVNAHRLGEDYRREELILTSGTRLDLHLAPGGGFAIRIMREP